MFDDGIVDHEDWPAAGEPTGFNYVDMTTAFVIDPDHGWHGMAVSGVIWGAVDNNIGIAGFQDSQLHVYVHQVSRNTGSAILWADNSRIAQAIYDAVNDGADILNFSWGNPCYTSDFNISLALDAAHNAGVLSIAAAGNCNGVFGCPCVHFPASHPDVVAVGGIDELTGNRHSESSYGPELDVVGYYDVYTLTLPTAKSADSEKAPCAPDGYDCVGGTSFAAPQAAAIAGLVLARRPDLKNQPDLLRDILRYSTDDGGTPCIEDTARIGDQLGWGRLDARRALLAVGRGDVNNAYGIEISDITYLSTYINKNGPEPIPELMVADVNCDCSVDMADLTYLVAHSFQGGPPPMICYKFPE